MNKRNSNFVNDLEKIYNDLNNIKISEDDSFKSSLNKFYGVMRKWGICQGVRTEHGITINTAEWNMCYQIFKAHKIMALDIFLVLQEPPCDLIAYDLEPMVQ